MKKRVLTTLLIFSVFISIGQVKFVSNNFTKTKTEKIDYTKIYDKNTGKKIKKKTFIKLVKKYPNLELKKIIDSYGNVEKYLIDVTKVNTTIINDRKTPTKKGELFPNFIVNTINNKKIELNKLRGKIVILRFELEANNFRFKKREIKQIDDIINQVNNKHKKVKAIIFFASNKFDINKGFDLKDSNFELVANSHNFHEKFSITRFPTTIIIDKEGKVIDYYKYFYDLDLTQITED